MCHLYHFKFLEQSKNSCIILIQIITKTFVHQYILYKYHTTHNNAGISAMKRSRDTMTKGELYVQALALNRANIRAEKKTERAAKRAKKAKQQEINKWMNPTSAWGVYKPPPVGVKTTWSDYNSRGNYYSRGKYKKPNKKSDAGCLIC